jgi:diacylglycerol kinase family enzyme
MTTLPRDPELTVTAVTADGHPAKIRGPSLAFVVGTMAPRLLPRPRRVNLDRGLMTLFALKPDDAMDVARLLLRTAVGDVAGDPDAERTLVRSAQIRGARRRLHATLDGESVLLRVPCAVEVRSGELSVFAPPATDEGEDDPEGMR